MNLILVLLLGLIVNLPFGIFAFRKQSLTIPWGIMSAGIIGIITFLAHPILWFLLMAFFSTSTLLTKFREIDHNKIQAMKYGEKGGKRDFWQVIANGGNGFISSILIVISVGVLYFDPHSNLIIFAATSYAASSADTWATEIGTTSKNKPRWIFNPWKTVPRGTSGGVSFLGFGASYLGSLTIGLIFGVWIALVDDISSIEILKIILLLSMGGFLGSLVDTILGATVQAAFQCPNCEKITEKTIHFHNKDITTRHYKGIRWINNDFVNFISGAIASLITVAIFIIL